MKTKLSYDLKIEDNNYEYSLLRGDEVIVTLSLYKIYDDVMWIDYIETKEAFRYKGYAKKLLNYAINNLGKCIYAGEALDESIGFCYAMGARFTSSRSSYHYYLMYLNYSDKLQDEDLFLYRLDKYFVYDSKSFKKEKPKYQLEVPSMFSGTTRINVTEEQLECIKANPEDINNILSDCCRKIDTYKIVPYKSPMF